MKEIYFNEADHYYRRYCVTLGLHERVFVLIDKSDTLDTTQILFECTSCTL